MISSRHRGWIGVDIGTRAVKLAQVERRHDRLRLSEALVIQRREVWPPELGDTVPISSSEEMNTGLSLGSGFQGRAAAVTLPMAVCDARGCTVAESADIDHCELVVQELNSVYGSASEVREFDFWRLQPPKQQGPPSENVIAFSVAKEWAQCVAADLTHARLVGRALDALPLALARAVELGTPGASNVPVAAVDWGCGRPTLCVVLGGRPQFVRCLRDAGFEGVLRSLCDTLSVNEEEAQKLLTDHGLPERDGGRCEELQQVIEEVVAEPLNRFLEELNRTLAFLRQQRRPLVPQELILFGGGASLRNVSEHVAEKVGLRVRPWTLEAVDVAADVGGLIPVSVFGPAIALSALAWSKV